MIITIPKGFNRSFPPQFRTTNSSFTWQYEISIDTPYILYDKEGNISPDQKDWNKLIGVKHHYLQPMKSSLMVGFAYNVETKLYDLCFYWHDADGTRHWSDIITSVKVKEKFRVTLGGGPAGTVAVYISKGTQGTKEVWMSEVFTQQLPPGRKYKINTWFGGNNPAPSTMKFTIKQLK